jgi:uncharacterized protein (DUF2164 family)
MKRTSSGFTNRLKELLLEEDREILLNLIDACYFMETEDGDLYYYHGFSDGVKFIIQSLSIAS